MRLPTTIQSRVILTLTVFAACIAIFATFMIISGDDKPATQAAKPGFGPSYDPFPDLGAAADSGPIEGPTGEGLLGTGEDNSTPLGSGSGSNVRDVKLVATSDGPLSILAYRTRKGTFRVTPDGKSSWSKQLTIRGQRPVAQVGFQVTGSATYITCKIFVDGQQVATKTVRGQYKVGLCTG